MNMAGKGRKNPDDFIDGIQMIDGWNRKQRAIYVATNRTSVEMQPISYVLNSEYGYWITENGGCLYDTKNETVEYPKKWEQYANKYIPSLLQHIQKYPGISLHHTSGYIRTLISCPPDISHHSFVETVIRPSLTDFSYRDLFTVAESKVISIEPIGLSKTDALSLFFQRNSIDPGSDLLFFIADSDRDIEMAQELSQYDTIIGAVGNSTEAFSKFVTGYKHGICAPISTSYHSSFSYLLRKFNDLIDNIDLDRVSYR
jgi:hydroxymethylpyrimidine pyrophosphatase-like HAD family hydrolase